jgi:hypothetical protein
MIAKLAKILEEFPGTANHTCCFTYVLNLVVKRIMKQFDAPKTSKQSGDNVELNHLANALDALKDELENNSGDTNDDDQMVENGDEDSEDMADGHEGMTALEIEELERSVKPVRRVLTKVSQT